MVVISGRTNSSEQTAEEINIKIDNYKSAIQSFFYECQIKNQIPTIQEVKDDYEKIKNDSIEVKKIEKLKVELIEVEPKKEISFYEVFDEFTSYNGKIINWATATYAKLKTLKTHLEAFNPKLRFEDLTLEGLSNVLIFLAKH